MVCFNTVVLLLSMAHMRAVLSDPGTVPLPQSRVDFSDIHCTESGLCYQCFGNSCYCSVFRF